MTPPALVLLDRDGTINVSPPEGDYVRDPAALELLPGAAAAVRRLNQAGVQVAVVTNQRGVALGLMSEDDVRAVHDRLEELLAAEGARVDAILYCPHAEGACACRKPEPGLLREAAERLGTPLERAAMVGDTARDVQAGRRAGVPTVLLADPATAGHGADLVVGGLGEAVAALLAN